MFLLLLLKVIDLFLVIVNSYLAGKMLEGKKYAKACVSLALTVIFIMFLFT